MKFRFAIFAIVGFVVSSLVVPPSCSADILLADLATDWSDVSNPNVNPNGTWTYREGSNALSSHSDLTVLAFDSPQPAWAPSNVAGNFLPAIFQATSMPFDWHVGDIVVHSTDNFGGPASGIANILWTSAVTGNVSLDGGVWMGRDIDRGNDWRLLLNGNLLSSGHIESGDPFSRDNPFAFSSGSGGAGAITNLAIVAGDQLQLEILRTSTFGDFVGVNLSISAVPVPEPSSIALLGLAGVIAGCRSIRRQRAGM